MGEYISGGRNDESYRYVRSKGCQLFPDKTEFIETLSGSWYNMSVYLAPDREIRLDTFMIFSPT